MGDRKQPTPPPTNQLKPEPPPAPPPPSGTGGRAPEPPADSELTRLVRELRLDASGECGRMASTDAYKAADAIEALREAAGRSPTPPPEPHQEGEEEGDELSDSYLRLRRELEPWGAMRTKFGGADRFEKTEAALDAALAELVASRDAAPREQDANANKLIQEAVDALRQLGTDLNRGSHPPNLAEQIWDECDQIATALRVSSRPAPVQEKETKKTMITIEKFYFNADEFEISSAACPGKWSLCFIPRGEDGLHLKITTLDRKTFAALLARIQAMGQGLLEADHPVKD